MIICKLILRCGFEDVFWYHSFIRREPEIFLTWHWMQFSLHFFKTGVCEFLKLLTFLIPLPFQCTPRKQLSVWQWLYFVSNASHKLFVRLFVAMVIPQPSRLFEDFGLEGIFMWTSLLSLPSASASTFLVMGTSPFLTVDDVYMWD